MSFTFNPERPIVLGLAGISGTGKTVTANGLAPMASVKPSNGVGDNISWSHLYFALPLYEMVTIRRTIEGHMRQDRIRYGIHQTLLEVFGNNPLFGAPPYEKIVEMVNYIATYPCDMDSKPRDFLQHIGTDVCRAYDPDCWVKWMYNAVNKEFALFQKDYRSHLKDLDEDEPEQPMPQFGIVISDIRFPNEASFVAKNPNGILLKLVADPEVIRERQKQRDGYAIAKEHSVHASETSVDEIDPSWYTEIVDTSDMAVEQQVKYVRNLVAEKIGLNTYA